MFPDETATPFHSHNFDGIQIVIHRAAVCDE